MYREIFHDFWKRAETYLNNGNLLKAIQLLEGLLKLTPVQLGRMPGLDSLTPIDSISDESRSKKVSEEEIFTRIWIASALAEYTTNYQDARNILLPVLATPGSDHIRASTRMNLYRLLARIYKLQGKHISSLKILAKAISAALEIEIPYSTFEETAICCIIIEYESAYISSHAYMHRTPEPPAPGSWLQKPDKIDAINSDCSVLDARRMVTRLSSIKSLLNRSSSNELRSWLKDYQKSYSNSAHAQVLARSPHEQSSPDTAKSIIFQRFLSVDMEILKIAEQHIDSTKLHDQPAILTEYVKSFLTETLHLDRCIYIFDRDTLIRLCILLSLRIKFGACQIFELYSSALTNICRILEISYSHQSHLHSTDWDSLLFKTIEKVLLSAEKRIRIFNSRQKQEARKLHPCHVAQISFYLQCKAYMYIQLALLDIQNISFERALRRIYIVCKVTKGYHKGLIDPELFKSEALTLIAIFFIAIGMPRIAMKNIVRLGNQQLTTAHSNYVHLLLKVVTEYTKLHENSKSSSLTGKGLILFLMYHVRKCDANAPMTLLNEQESGDLRNELSSESLLGLGDKAALFFEKYAAQDPLQAQGTKALIGWSIQYANGLHDKLLLLNVLHWLINFSVKARCPYKIQTKNVPSYIRLYDKYSSEVRKFSDNTSDTNEIGLFPRELKFIFDFV